VVNAFACRKETRRPMRRTFGSKRILVGVLCGQRFRRHMSFGLTCPGKEAVPRQYEADSSTAAERDNSLTPISGCRGRSDGAPGHYQFRRKNLVNSLCNCSARTRIKMCASTRRSVRWYIGRTNYITNRPKFKMTHYPRLSRIGFVRVLWYV